MRPDVQRITVRTLSLRRGCCPGVEWILGVVPHASANHGPGAGWSGPDRWLPPTSEVGRSPNGRERRRGNGRQRTVHFSSTRRGARGAAMPYLAGSASRSPVWSGGSDAVILQEPPDGRTCRVCRTELPAGRRSGRAGVAGVDDRRPGGDRHRCNPVPARSPACWPSGSATTSALDHHGAERHSQG